MCFPKRATSQLEMTPQRSARMHAVCQRGENNKMENSILFGHILTPQRDHAPRDPGFKVYTTGRRRCWGPKLGSTCALSHSWGCETPKAKCGSGDVPFTYSYSYNYTWIFSSPFIPRGSHLAHTHSKGQDWVFLWVFTPLLSTSQTLLRTLVAHLPYHPRAQTKNGVCFNRAEVQAGNEKLPNTHQSREPPR